MKQRIKTLLLLALVLFSTHSCLEKYPIDAVPTEDAIKTVKDAEQAVIGIYATFRNQALHSGLLTLLPDIQSDMVNAVQGYSNRYGEFWRWEVNATNLNVRSVYGSLYQVIGRCNFTLEGIEAIEDQVVSNADYEKIRSLKGEAYFARALAYSELIKFFCKDYEPTTAAEELGVVLIKSFSNAPAIKRRSNLQASYDFVLEDLEKAAEYLEDANLTNTNYYNSIYISKYTVESLLARVYLYMDDAENAIKHSSNVIDSGEFLLSDVNTYMAYGTATVNAYQYMLITDNSTEVIWKIGFQGPASFGGRLGFPFLGYTPGAGFLPDYIPTLETITKYPVSDQRRTALFQTETTSYGFPATMLIKYYGNQSFIANYGLFHMSMPKVFRLSEQYLIRAEAYAMLGNYGEAAKDITTLRKARYTSYNTTAMSEENWLEIIDEERFKELYMEGFRLNDLKRWKKGFSRKAQANTVSPGNTLEIKASNPLFVWPIPDHEINSPDADILPNESNS